MRTLIIAFSCLISTCVFSQNITNTLGTIGVFTIKDASTNYFILSQSTGQVNILKTLRIENTTSSTTGVIFKGTDSFLHNYGTANTFLGINSGNFTTTGVQNTALGYGSLSSNTSGNNNTALGRASLFNNNTGNENTSVGTFSLSFNTIGNYNTALGTYSLGQNFMGNQNTAAGWGSLYFNTSGSKNTAVGFQSLYSNAIGIYNTAVGHSSLFSNTGNLNTAVGYYSLYSNNTGTENTAVGYQSLFSSTINSGNTAVGWNSLYSSTGYQNTAVGHHSLNTNTGNFNTALGYNAGSLVTTGYNLTLIGIDANPTNGTAFDQVTLGNSFVSSLRCNVTTITSLSDARDKKNITNLSLGLDFITKLKPRQFNWDKREWYDDNISDGSKMKESPTAGFIAQELDETQTTENAEWLNLVLKDNSEKWEATPGNLLPIMVKAIQELNEENEKLSKGLLAEKVQSERLQVKNEALEERLDKYEQIQIMLVSELREMKSREKVESSDLTESSK